MDKTPIEVLAEVTWKPNGSYKHEEEIQQSDCIIFSQEALEAMKIFGKQCFDDARKQVGQPDFAQYLYENWNEYIELLEEKK